MIMVQLAMPVKSPPEVFIAKDLDGWWDIFLPEHTFDEGPVYERYKSYETFINALEQARIACGTFLDLKESPIVICGGSVPDFTIDDPSDDLACVQAILVFS